MPTAPTFPLYDRILNGQLEELLRELVATQSVPEIRDTLRDEHQISVSVATVHRWLRDRAIQKPAEPDEAVS